MEEEEDEFGEMPSFDREVNKVAQQLTREQLKNILPAQLTTLKRSKLSSTRASKQQAGLPEDSKVQEVLPLIILFCRCRCRRRCLCRCRCRCRCRFRCRFRCNAAAAAAGVGVGKCQRCLDGRMMA